MGDWRSSAASFPPATRDEDELRETLDLLGTVMASLSDRVDGQTAALDRLTKTAAETRSAALHARDRMDMKPVAEAIGIFMERDIGPATNEMRALGRAVEADRRAVRADIDALLRGTTEIMEQRRRQLEGLKTRSWIPLLALVAVLIAFATALLAPWGLAKLSGELLCRLAGGDWFSSSRACWL